MDLIELQAVIEKTKNGYSENSLVDFYVLCLWNVFQFVPSCKKKFSPSLVARTDVSNCLKK